MFIDIEADFINYVTSAIYTPDLLMKHMADRFAMEN
jgi:hypothetical protein